jgi:class 3 adenylate cyclase/tetratricopeptide (TPR) repeat protein
LRTVSALFADICGSSALAERLDAEDFTALVGEAVASMAAVVESFGGTIEHSAGDGMLALFGAPVAHEDDAERAVLAGLALVGGTLAVRVGIETGPVVVGAVGAGRALEFMAMGDSVNTAAGLQAATRPDTVLVGERTRSIVEGLFAWGAAREFTLKGKAAPVVACEARMRRPGAGRPAGETELIGRAAELDEGVACLRAVRGGTGSVLVIVGEAGVGKSRLLAELRACFAEEGAWLEARCASYEQAVPYRPLESLLGERAGVVLQAAAREDLAPPDRRRRAAAALRTQLRDLAAQRPVAVVVDDAHWMDPSSAALLALALPATEDAALLLVLAARPEPDAPVAPLLAKADGVRRIDLAPLDAEAGRRLVRALAREPLPADLEREVVERGEGNPFYLQEFVRSLAGGRRDHAVPDAIERVILARIDRLPVPAREAVAAAAVLGRRFDAALLDAVSDIGTALPEALDELVRERLVLREGRDYGFAHTLLQETAYGSLLRARRRELHGRAASALRELAPGEHALIAAHYAAACDDRNAMAEHGQAAAAAFAVGALEEAIAQDDAALAAAKRLGDAAEASAVRELLQRRSWGRCLLGDRRGAREDAERALAAARAADDRGGRLAALALIGLLRDGDIEQAVEMQHEALELAHSLRNRDAEVEILARLAILLVARLQLGLARDHATRAEELASGNDRLIGKALDAAKLVSLNLGELDRVEHVCTRLAAIHRAHDDRFMLAFALLEGAFVPLARGRWDEAEDRLRRAVEINATSGNAFTRPLFLDGLCWLRRSRGAVGEAVAAGREANELAERIGIPEFAAWTAATLGWALLDAGDHEEAAAVLHRGLAHATSVRATVQALRCAALLADARLRSRDLAGARAAAGHAAAALALGSTPAGGAFVYGAHAVVALARVRLALGDRDRVEALAGPLLVAAERSGWLEAIADCATVMAQARLAIGDARGSAELAERAVRAARDGRLPRAAREARTALAAAARSHVT